jgi:hypothetical protein
MAHSPRHTTSIIPDQSTATPLERQGEKLSDVVPTSQPDNPADEPLDELLERWRLHWIADPDANFGGEP